ncbi:carbohydrate-binding protein, partial [Mycobacterium tuberculosis]|uniref:carbohydrate-binding protein n=1 Tax=Mycobacterium tuberculosis TaxID=1773 RepID=UPI00126640FD
SSQSGLETENCSDTGGGLNIGYIQNEDYAVYAGLDFGSGATGFSARVASATSGGTIEIRLDSIDGPLVGTCVVPGTGGWQTWVTVNASVSGVSGSHDLYLKFTGGSAD